MFPWIWDKLSWETSELLRSEILGLFVNPLTAEYQYSRRNMMNFQQQLQTQVSQKRKSFSRFFIAFLKSTSRLEHFEKKMSLVAQVFPKLLIPREVDTQISKRPYSEQVSVNKVLAGSKHGPNPQGSTNTKFFHESWINWVGKSLL